MERPGRIRLAIDIDSELLGRVYKATGGPKRGKNSPLKPWLTEAIKGKLEEQPRFETDSPGSLVRFSVCRPHELADHVRRYSEDATSLIDIVGHDLPALLLHTDSFAQFLRERVEQGMSLTVIFTSSEVDSTSLDKLKALQDLANRSQMVEIWGMTHQTIAPRNEYILIDDCNPKIAKGLMIINEPNNYQVQLFEFRAERDFDTYRYLARNAQLAAMKRL